MTDKSWLIRTKNNQILGPISKAKLMEFLQKGALNPEDEVSSGNGYWFWIKESELVARYLNGDIPQTFNPISEAKDVITSSLTENKTASISRIPSHQPQQSKKPVPAQKTMPELGDLELPNPSDLNLPDLAPSKSESNPTKKKAIEVKADHNDPPGEGDNIKYPETEDLEFPDSGDGMGASTEAEEATDPMMVMPELDQNEEDISTEFEDLSEVNEIEDNPEDTNPTLPRSNPPEAGKKKAELIPPKAPSAPKKENSGKTGKRKSRIVQTPARNDNYLRYLMVVLVFMIIAVLYYYFEILNRPISEVSNIFINSAVAQEVNTVVKKKALLTFLS